VETVVIIAMVVSWAFVAFLAFVLYGFMRQHAELLTNLAELRATLQRQPIPVTAPPPAPAAQDPQPAGLQIGAQAPDFSLPDLAGRQRRLEDFLGRPRLLVFWDPQCGFCQQMAPRIAQLPDPSQLLLVTRRAPEETRTMAQQHDLHCDIVVEPAWDVATSYGTNGTPTGYLIDAQGRIASTLAIGADALLALAA